MSCIETKAQKHIVVKENGKTFRISNSKGKEITQIRIDGCLIKEGLKCDWGFFIESIRGILVELKGKHVSHAVDQVDATLSHPMFSGQVKECYIVCSSYPALGPSLQTRIVKFKKSHGFSPTIKTMTCEILA